MRLIHIFHPTHLEITPIEGYWKVSNLDTSAARSVSLERCWKTVQLGHLTQLILQVLLWRFKQSTLFQWNKAKSVQCGHFNDVISLVYYQRVLWISDHSLFQIKAVDKVAT